MEILFAGLVAFGIAAAIVFCLKCFCFIAEFVSAQRKLMSNTQLQTLQNYAQTTDSPANYADSIAPVTDLNVPGSSINYMRCLVERSIFINSETGSRSYVEPPPTYEEAVRLTTSNDNPFIESKELQP